MSVFFVHGCNKKKATCPNYAWLFQYAVQAIVLPALLTFYRIDSDDYLVNSIRRLIHQIGVDVGHQVQKRIIDPLDSRLINLSSDNEGIIQDVKTGSMKLALSVYRLAEDFKPIKKELEETLSTHEIKIVIRSIKDKINDSQSAGSGTEIELTLDLDISEGLRLRGALPFRRIIREIFLNCTWAINQRKQDRQEASYIGKIVVSLKKATKDPYEYILKVRDNGVGLTPQAHGRATRIGYSTRSNGTGLGLSLVSINAGFFDGGIIKLHSLSSVSDTETGTVIEVGLGKLNAE